MNTSYSVKCENLSKVYRLYEHPSDRLKEALFPFKKRSKDFYALNDVSFEIEKGKTVGLVGRNGSGKSTLLKVLTGVLSPTAGKVQTHGRVAALLELGAGFNLEMTGIENIYLSASIMGLSKKEIEQKIPEILSFADIGDFVYQPVKWYSSGMFVRLAFSLAIYFEPDILIVDEALSVGDVEFQKKCYQQFYRIRDSGATILLVTHDSYIIRKYCHEAIYLKNGKIAARGDTESICHAYQEDQRAHQATLKKEDLPTAFSVNSCRLLDAEGAETAVFSLGQPLTVELEYKNISDYEKPVSFVFNIYRSDETYCCGGTSLMDGLAPVVANEEGKIRINFSSLNLLSGSYWIRVAINDEEGFAVLGAVESPVRFSIQDRCESFGLVHINRSWDIQ